MTNKVQSMVVEVRLFATLRQGRFKKRKLELPNQSSVADLLENLKIPLEEPGILLVNGRKVNVGQPLAADDVVAVFPSIGGG